MDHKKYAAAALAASLLGSAALVAPVLTFAQTTDAVAPTAQGTRVHGDGMMGRRAPGVFGTVSSISGTSIVITSKAGPNGAAGATYTVDASKATVEKGGTTAALGAIAVGDTVMVQGTITGTNVEATKIRDGIPQRGAGMMGGRGMGNGTSSMPALQGNGQPIIGGTVSAIAGSTITVTNASGVTYTIDASKSTITKGAVASSLSAIMTGDRLMVQGTVNGTAVTAASILDQGSPSATAPQTTGTPGQPVARGGLFGMIGGMFSKLFGFF